MKDSARIEAWEIDDRISSGVATAAYYQKLHNEVDVYKTNNWLVDHIDKLISCQPETLVEVGSGNCKFLRKAAKHVGRVIGLDWAFSPEAINLPSNVTFLKRDITLDPIPAGHMICSADVLEHIRPNHIPMVLRKLDSAAPLNYHVIACYDDRHSHLSIMSPNDWLNQFRLLSQRYEIVDISFRRNDQSAVVCVISNFP